MKSTVHHYRLVELQVELWLEWDRELQRLDPLWVCHSCSDSEESLEPDHSKPNRVSGQQGSAQFLSVHEDPGVVLELDFADDEASLVAVASIASYPKPQLSLPDTLVAARSGGNNLVDVAECIVGSRRFEEAPDSHSGTLLYCESQVGESVRKQESCSSGVYDSSLSKDTFDGSSSLVLP